MASSRMNFLRYSLYDSRSSLNSAVSPIAPSIGNVVDDPSRYAGYLGDGFLIEPKLVHHLYEYGNLCVSAFRHKSLFVFSQSLGGRLNISTHCNSESMSAQCLLFNADTRLNKNLCAECEECAELKESAKTKT
jgi:hypothetical protein